MSFARTLHGTLLIPLQQLQLFLLTKFPVVCSISADHLLGEPSFPAVLRKRGKEAVLEKWLLLSNTMSSVRVCYYMENDLKVTKRARVKWALIKKDFRNKK